MCQHNKDWTMEEKNISEKLVFKKKIQSIKKKESVYVLTEEENIWPTS